MKPLHIVILAAGQGTRMKSRLPKVLQPLGGRSLLSHVIDTSRSLKPAKTHVVYGHGGEKVIQVMNHDHIHWVEQSRQLGTGHAVKTALKHIPDGAKVLVLYGDVPLIRAASLRKLVRKLQTHSAALITVDLDEPDGYGRILRDEQNNLTGIVEEKDATAAQKAISETNTGIMAFDSVSLRKWLTKINRNNAQGEYYLTDVVEIAVSQGKKLASIQPSDAWEVRGVNDKIQLARLERHYQMTQAVSLMKKGLTLMDPARFDLRGRLRFGQDTTIDVNAVIEGNVTLGNDVSVGPNCVLRDCRIADGTQILAHTVIESAYIGEKCSIGPFARIRPDTRLKTGAKIGNFVETKKVVVGEGTKINHLSYVGDADVGKNSNIGAGVITCNYDGVNKHRTVIGDDVFVGSDCQLVAPVRIEAGATIGAGTTLTKTAPASQLTLSRAKQVTVKGWKKPEKREANGERRKAGDQKK